MWKCKHCLKDFDLTETSSKANHSRWCDSNPKRNDTKGLLEGAAKYQNRRLGSLAKFSVSCDNCSTNFEVVEREKTFPKKQSYFCSRSCAAHRGTGLEWGSGKRTITQYKTICFAHHERACIVCGEDKIVEVHHLDENHANNDPANLIPLCPTHHQYWHSQYKDEVESTVMSYINMWKKNK